MADTPSRFLIKAHPKATNFGTLAIGSLPHFFGEMIRAATGADMVHVPHPGLGTLRTELMSGRIPAGVAALGDFIELHRAGKIRIVATSGARRSPLLPTVPTFEEEGFPAVEGNGWTAMFAPAGTPRPVIDQFSKAIVAAVRVPAVVDKLTRLGIEPTGTTPKELAEIMAADAIRWEKAIKASGFEAK